MEKSHDHKSSQKSLKIIKWAKSQKVKKVGFFRENAMFVLIYAVTEITKLIKL